MQIIIPMAGSGQRFINAGYKDIKPLIKVGGKTIIEHVINLFPTEENFLFICNNEHLKNLPLENFLLLLKPKAKILGIDSHKLGPVYSVMMAKDYVKESEPVIVNYCDFFMHWDYGNFKNRMVDEKADGAVVSYTGFHPHLLGPNFYAGVKADKQNNILEIKEKHSYTEDKMQGWHSNGTYYFKNGELVKKYFAKLVHSKLSHSNGEYYVSMVYNLLIAAGLKTVLYPIDYFCQWGTPEDLQEFNRWMDAANLPEQKLTNETQKQIGNYWANFLSKTSNPQAFI